MGLSFDELAYFVLNFLEFTDIYFGELKIKNRVNGFVRPPKKDIDKLFDVRRVRNV